MAAIFGWEIACIPVSGSRKKKNMDAAHVLFVHQLISMFTMIYTETTLANWVFHTNNLNKESELYTHDVKQSEVLKPQLCSLSASNEYIARFRPTRSNAAATLLTYLVTRCPRLAAEIALQQLSLNLHRRYPHERYQDHTMRPITSLPWIEATLQNLGP